MKKAIFIILITLSFMGCNEFLEDCRCGYIVSYSPHDESVVISNDCTGNLKRWYVSDGGYKYAHVGKNYCITNTTVW